MSAAASESASGAVPGYYDRLYQRLQDAGLPPGGLVLPWPYPGKPGAATVDGVPAQWHDGELRIDRPGARVRIAAPAP